MPTYDYRCPANGQTVEVTHRMSESLGTWGELCERAGIDCGDTPADSPVERIISGAAVIGASSGESAIPQGGSCCGGGCGCG